MKKKKKKKKEGCNHRFDEGHVVHLAHPASEYLTQVSQQPDSCFQHLFALLLVRGGGGGGRGSVKVDEKGVTVTYICMYSERDWRREIGGERGKQRERERE